jgi:RHS repeat-associated protein
MKKLLGFASLLLLSVFLTSVPIAAQQPTTVYVNRADPACGGHSPCYATIQAAINVVGPRTTIRIQAGVYPEQLLIQKNDFTGAVEADRIVIEADPALAPGSVVVRPPAASCLSGHAILIRRSKFVTLRGLTITGATGAGIVLLGGAQQNRGIHIEFDRVVGNASPSCPTGGIVIALGNPDTLVVNTIIHSNGGSGINFADGSGGPHWIIQNTIHANSWNGVHIVLGNMVTLANNIITGNGRATGTVGGRHGVRRIGLAGQTPQSVTLLNNLICGNRLGEINGPVLDSTDSGNFTPQGNERAGVSARPGCQVPANLHANVNGADGVPNTPDDDFSLKQNSLAIDVGMDPRTLSLDPAFDPIFEADFLDEGVRPADGNADRFVAFDAGAFEYPNELPLAHAGVDQSAFRGQLVALNGKASSDPEGASLTFQWIVLSQPAGSSITLAGIATVNPTFTPLLLGEYIFQLVVSDGQQASQPDTVKVTVINRAPSANAGGPYAGNVNAPIQFAGSGADPDGDPISFSWNFADGGTATGPNPTRAYAAGGTYTVTLTVTDAFGASAIAQTTATINATLTLNSIGNKTVNLGETLTFTITASNPGGGSVGLYVAPLPLMINAAFNTSTGVFTFRPAAAQVGIYQLTFAARAGVNSASETITITVPQPPPGGTTGVRGLIHNLNNTPLANVRVALNSSGHTAFTGADGFFTITGVPSGTQQLIVNGREANLGVYAIIAVAVDLIDGVLNVLNSPISLPDVDVDAEVPVSPTFNTVVSNPSLPGVELEIIGGSATNPDGTPFTGKLSINPVPDYGRPESRPEELRPGFAVTIQPAGIRFNPPARITFPNADGMAPNNELNLWSLSPDTGKFNIVGKSAVSADGQSIITVEGGVTASAWHFPLATSTTSNPSQGNSFCGSCRTSVGSDANLEEGSLYISHSLPSYRSLGQSRSLSLTYSSVTADPRPIVSLDSTLGVRAAVPNTFSTRLKVGGVQQGGEIFTNSSSLPEDADSTSRISVQFDASTLATGRYPFEATVFSNYLNSAVGGISTGNVIVVNRSNSALGAGWAITDLQHIHFQSGDGALLTSGDGTALFFSGGPDTFTAPAREFSILTRNPDGTYTRTSKDGTKVYFNGQGLQISVIDRNANTTSFSYDGNGRLITVTDPIGLVTTLTYAGAKLEKITDPAGRQTLFQYDTVGNLSRITSPDSRFVTYGYDGKNHITQATDERGQSTTYAYDFAGRFAQSTRPSGETRGLVPSKLRGLVDTAGGQGTPTNPAPIVTNQNASAALTDARGNQSRFSLDVLGQVTSQTDALGQTTATLRDANGLPTRITRPNGAVTSMTYDAKGNLLTSTDPVGAATVFTYEPTFNQVKTIRDPKGNTTTINYDIKGNPIEIIDALSNRTQMTYDTRGLLLSVTSAVGTPVQNTTSFTYDARGNLLTTTNPKGDVTTLAYDSAGNVSKSTDAENRVMQFTYDLRNRLITVLDADLNTTQYGYDPKGNLTQVRDAKNQLTTFVYDGLDRLASATNPLGLTETFTYDGNGNLTSTTNRNGQTIAFNYDALNRLTSKTRPPTSMEAGNQSTTFSYDSVGNVTSITNPTVGVLNQYDAANRLISSTSTTESVLSGTIVPINVDTTIGANNSQFEGKTVQVNGRILTVDGTHTFANLLLVNGAVLRHSPTTSNTIGKLDITVTGAIQIDLTSRIDVTGLGFLAAGRSGNPFPQNGMTLGFQKGSGDLSGGSYGGVAGTLGSSVPNVVYGDFRNPNEPGSGGGAVGVPGGNGGGLIRIVAQTLSLSGAIRANGRLVDVGGSASGGSGGGIRIDVGTITGSGSITANGSPGGGTSGGGGSGGRIAIYYQNATGFNLGNVSTFGTTGPNATNAGAGTVYLQGPARESGEIIVDNNNLAAPSLSTPILGASTSTLTLTHFRVRRGARAKADSTLNLSGTFEIATSGELAAGNRIVADTTNLTTNAVLTHLATTGTATFKVDLNSQSITVDSTSRIDATRLGFLAAGRPGNPFPSNGMTFGFQQGSGSLSGGSYGGLGGSGGSSVANAVYGDFRNPNEPGSGGGAVGVPGGNGGGLIRIVAQTLNLSGAIRANGGLVDVGGSAAGGSGGGIRIDVGTISGSGSISANGIPGGGTTGGGGSGGRIAIYYQNATGFNFGNVSAFGTTGPNATNAGAGTIYLQGTARESGDLVVDNNHVVARSLSTPILGASTSTLTLTHFRVRRGARAKLDSTLNLTGTLEIATGGEFAAGNRLIADTTVLTSNAVLTHLATTGSTTFKVDLHTDTLTIDSSSRVDVTGFGFLGQARLGNPFPNNGMTLGFQQGSTSGSGGSYGGLGGGSNPNPMYGGLQNPNEPGSGGGAFTVPAGNGGGLIRIAATTFTLNGIVRANAGATEVGGSASGGSGGGIRIDAGTISGTGSLSANGSQASQVGGGGGGGRIAIYYQTNGGFNFFNVSALGGSGGPAGQSGTVHIQQQIAMQVPRGEEAPVMRADVERKTSTSDPIRSANVGSFRKLSPDNGDRPQLRVFSPDAVLSTQHSVLREHSNLYLAMVAEGKLKPFATTVMLSQGTGVSGAVLDNPQSKIKNPKLSDLTTQSSALSAQNLSAADFDPIYTYDLNGNRTSMIDPTGLTTYTYDSLNRLTSITNNQGRVTSFQYDALGRRTSMTHANGVVTSYTYDAASQLLSLAHQLGATTINSFAYTYDKVGNRKSKADSSGTANYTYDVLNRLTQAVNPLPTNPLETFNYDPVGNRTNSNQNGASNFNQANQLLEDANFAYQYDNSGNMTRKTAKVGGAITQFEYDAENKLVRAVTNGTSANYRYDGLGRRVEKEVISVGTTVTRYVYDNEDILLELTGTNAIVARYTHGPGIDEPLIVEKNAQVFHYHADGLGSVTELTNESAMVIQQYAYSSFGRIESQRELNFVQAYTFTSRELDAETGIYSYRARAYDSQTGRFLQPDPIGAFGGSLNLYPYVINAPLNYTDPSGNIVQFLSPDSYLDLGYIAYDIYRIVVDNVLNDCNNLATNLASLGGNVVGLTVPGLTGVGAALRGAQKRTLVIGKLKDLDAASLKTSEFVLEWQKKANPQLNWQENSTLLRDAMAKGRPIRDASIDVFGELRDNTGFLRAERNLLDTQGWKYKMGYWQPSRPR